MRKFLAIVGREWRAYFFSPLAYVILAAFLLMNGMVFSTILNILNAPQTPKGQAFPLLFSNIFFFLFNLIVIPVLGMRLFAEERKTGTLEVLLTSPVSEAQVVLGKFFGALGFFLTLWLPTLSYVAILRSQTPIDVGPVATAYLGTTLMGAYWLSIATFASTLTKNQIVAAILAFGLLIPVIFGAWFLEIITNDPSKKDLIAYFNPLNQMQEEFVLGILDTRRLIYYLSGTGLFLFLATISLIAKKENP